MGEKGERGEKHLRTPTFLGDILDEEKTLFQELGMMDETRLTFLTGQNKQTERDTNNKQQQTKQQHDTAHTCIQHIKERVVSITMSIPSTLHAYNVMPTYNSLRCISTINVIVSMRAFSSYVYISLVIDGSNFAIQ